MSFHFSTKLNHSNASNILVTHGFMGSIDFFNEIIKSLNTKFNYISVELPFHGQSTLSSPLSLTNFYEDIVQFIDKHNIKASIGYSMGARLLAECFSLHNVNLDFNILISSSFGIEDTAQRQQRLQQDGHLLDGITSKEQWKQFLEKWYSLDLFHGIDKKKCITDRLDFNPQQMSLCLRSFSSGRQSFFLTNYFELKTPSLYIYGDLDEKYKKLALSLKGFYNCKTDCILNCSHNPISQKPKELVDKINSFLNDK